MSRLSTDIHKKTKVIVELEYLISQHNERIKELEAKIRLEKIGKFPVFKSEFDIIALQKSCENYLYNITTKNWTYETSFLQEVLTICFDKEEYKDFFDRINLLKIKDEI